MILNPENSEESTFLGKGSYGYVERVFRDGEYRARKRMLCSAECYREIGALKLLPPHDRIVKLHEVVPMPEANSMEIYLEYMPGGNLQDFLEDHQADMKRLQFHFSIQLLQGVCFLHGHNIVHRDLKPANILLTSNEPDVEMPQLKIADFGLVQVICGGGGRTPVVRGISLNRMIPILLTVIFEVCTLYYRAPEILAGKMYNEAVDNWSAGCMILQMHTVRASKAFFSPRNHSNCEKEASEQQAIVILR